MNVTHYSSGGIGGDFGTANALRGWCEALSRAGAQVRLLFNGRTDSGRRLDGVECVPLRHRGRHRFRVPLGLADALSGTDVLVLHGGWVVGNNLAAALAAHRGVPYIVMPHGAYHPRVLRRRAPAKLAWAALSERRYLNKALAVHLFFADEEEGLRALGVDPPVLVAPNGFSPLDGFVWRGDQDGYVLWFGRFDIEGKGLDLLLDCMALLPAADRPHLRLHGPDWRNKKKEVLGLVDRLALRPWVTVGEAVYGRQKWELLAGAAGFVYPSRWDAAPMAVLEATSAGVPALVTPYPLGRALAEKGAAILTEATPESVAAGLRQLVSPPARLVGGRAAVVVRECFNWEVSARKWLDQTSALLRSP